MLMADRYAELQRATRVRERALFPLQRCPSELEIQARGLNDRVVIAERLPLLEVHGAPVYVYRRRDHGSPAIPVLADLDLADRPARGRVRALPSGAGGVPGRAVPRAVPFG